MARFLRSQGSVTIKRQRFLGNAFYNSLSETITLNDGILSKLTTRVLADTLTFTDTLTKLTQKVLQLEITTLTDTLLKMAGKLFSETVTHTDSLIKQITKVFSETTTLTDALTTLFIAGAAAAKNYYTGGISAAKRMLRGMGF